MIRSPSCVGRAGVAPVPGTCAHQRTPPPIAHTHTHSLTHPAALRRKPTWATMTGSPPDLLKPHRQVPCLPAPQMSCLFYKDFLLFLPPVLGNFEGTRAWGKQGVWHVEANGKRKAKKVRVTCLGCRGTRKRPLQNNWSNNNSLNLLLTYCGQAPFQDFLCINLGTMPKPISVHCILMGNVTDLVRNMTWRRFQWAFY